MHADNLLSYQIFSESLYESFALYYNTDTGRIQTSNTDNSGGNAPIFDPNIPEHAEAARARARELFIDSGDAINNRNRKEAEQLWGYLTPEQQNAHLIRQSQKDDYWGHTPGSDKFYGDKLTYSDGKLSVAEPYRINITGSNNMVGMNGDGSDTPPPPTYKTFDPSKDQELINAIWRGDYGVGAERRNKLSQVYGEQGAKNIQNYINQQAIPTAPTTHGYKDFIPNSEEGQALIQSIWDGKYGVGQARREALTNEYGAANAKNIQNYINQQATQTGSSTPTNTNNQQDKSVSAKPVQETNYRGTVPR